jgi:hypothetical protein
MHWCLKYGRPCYKSVLLIVGFVTFVYEMAFEAIAQKLNSLKRHNPNG